MLEVFKWLIIWAVIGGSIYASLNFSAFDLVRSVQGRPAKTLEVVPQAIELKEEPAPVVANTVPASQPPLPSSPATEARFVIGNTDRAGVYIRRSKSDADKIRAWVDGTVMVAVGPREELNGVAWRNVRDPAGNTGWIQERYLNATNLPAATPAAVATPVPVTAPAETGGRVELLMSSMSRGYGFMVVEGQVRNAGANSLHNIIAVVSLRNGDTSASRPEEQFIQSNPLAAGQISAFKVIIATSTEIKGYDLSFRSLVGENITTVDLRKR